MYLFSYTKMKDSFRKFTVKFKAEVDPELGWEFEPVQD